MKDRNGSGYFDPTADAAIYKADRKPRRVVLVWRAPEEIAHATGMRLREVMRIRREWIDLRERAVNDGRED